VRKGIEPPLGGHYKMLWRKEECMGSFDPLREMQAIQERMNRLFRESGRGATSPEHQD